MLMTLRRGSQGEYVARWQNFLRGEEVRLDLIASGDFDAYTEEVTKAFQTHCGLTADGVVGKRTLALAMEHGYDPDIPLEEPEPVPTTDAAETTTEAEPEPKLLIPATRVADGNWPAFPDFAPLSGAEREHLMGHFSFEAAPDKGPESVRLLDDWYQKNIIKVTLPFREEPVRFHRAVSKQLIGLFTAWQEAGLMPLIKTWDGSYNARFIRGSRSHLSNHAWGSAFDINYKWNKLGVRPAAPGIDGSVCELVALAHQFGFYWGGHFRKRPDGMHFEIAKIL